MIKARAPRRNKCWRSESQQTRTALVFFPHLQAGAARRPLSSKPKPGKSKKVPNIHGNFAILLDDLQFPSGA